MGAEAGGGHGVTLGVCVPSLILELVQAGWMDGRMGSGRDFLTITPDNPPAGLLLLVLGVSGSAALESQSQVGDPSRGHRDRPPELGAEPSTKSCASDPGGKQRGSLLVGVRGLGYQGEMGRAPRQTLVETHSSHERAAGTEVTKGWGGPAAGGPHAAGVWEKSEEMWDKQREDKTTHAEERSDRGKHSDYKRQS